MISLLLSVFSLFSLIGCLHLVTGDVCHAKTASRRRLPQRRQLRDFEPALDAGQSQAARPEPQAHVAVALGGQQLCVAADAQTDDDQLRDEV